MAASELFPYAVWLQGTNQNSIPANDNSLRTEVLSKAAIDVADSAPGSPADGDIHIVGTAWGSFSTDDVVIYKGGTWLAYAPFDGWIKYNNDTAELLVFDSGTGWVVITSGGGGAGDMLSILTAAEISITGASTLTLGRMHVCSGTSADYTVTLPAVSGNAGKFVGVRIDAACTRWITLDGNGSEQIDGALSRKLWRHESCVLFCDGVSWTKVAGKTIPLKCTMNKAGTTAIAPGAWTVMPMDTVVRDNASFMATPLADTTNGLIRILRDGAYTVSGYSNYVSVTAGKVQAVGVINRKATPPVSYSINDPQDDPSAWLGLPSDASGNIYLSAAAAFDGAVSGDSFAITTFNNDTVSRSNTSGITIKPSLSAIEIPSW